MNNSEKEAWYTLEKSIKLKYKDIGKGILELINENALCTKFEYSEQDIKNLERLLKKYYGIKIHE